MGRGTIVSPGRGRSMDQIPYRAPPLHDRRRTGGDDVPSPIGRGSIGHRDDPPVTRPEQHDRRSVRRPVRRPTCSRIPNHGRRATIGPRMRFVTRRLNRPSRGGVARRRPGVLGQARGIDASVSPKISTASAISADGDVDRRQPADDLVRAAGRSGPAGRRRRTRRSADPAAAPSGSRVVAIPDELHARPSGPVRGCRRSGRPRRRSGRVRRSAPRRARRRSR